VLMKCGIWLISLKQQVYADIIALTKVYDYYFVS
jgi:hypothetical protein